MWTAGETAEPVLLDTEGLWKITHLWFVQTCSHMLGLGLVPYCRSECVVEMHNALGLTHENSNTDYNRNVIIRLYCDSPQVPIVIAPVEPPFSATQSLRPSSPRPFTVSVRLSVPKKVWQAASVHLLPHNAFEQAARF